jgi:hypothetical protein
LYKITKKEIQKLNFFEQREFGGYKIMKAKVIANNQDLNAFTFVMGKNNEFSKPSVEYLGKIIIGLHQHGFDAKYINKTIAKAKYF